MHGWQVKPLGQLCTIKPPKSEARAKLNDSDEVSFAPMEDLGIGQKYLVPGRTRRLDEVNGSYTYFADGDVLLAKITPCFENGKLGVARGLTNGVGFGSSEYIVLRPTPTLDAEFLYYYLARPKFLEEGARTMAGAVGHKRITKEFIENYPTPLPPLPEQRRIVAILDEAFEAIKTAKANTEKNLLNSREVFTSSVERVFSEQGANWRRVSLESVGVTQTGSTPKSSEPENLGDYLPFVKPGDFKRDGSITFDNEGLSESGARKARRVKANSALMVCIGATIGKAAFSEREIATNQQVNSWTPTTYTSAKFIYYQMTSSDFQLRVRQSAGQATLPIINKSKWSALTVVIPPTLDEQLKIVIGLDSLLAESMNLEAVYEGKLTALDELKKSLLHQAFTGALTAKSTDKQMEMVA
jgi:type I restriction enzyme S subunit